MSPSWRIDSGSGSSPLTPRARGAEADDDSRRTSRRKRPGWTISTSAPADRDDSDEAVMERVREGHRTAFGVLLERHWSALVTYAAAIVGSSDAAKDVVQDTFVRVWQKREEWTPGGSVTAYLYRIVRNLSLNARRDLRTSRRHEDRSGEARARQAPPRTPAETLEASTLRQEVEAAIEALPERRREVFVLSRFHGLTHREIAEAMEISPQTVSNQMSAALSELRQALCHHLEGP